MLSLFYALFFLAAGSNASPCKPKPSGGVGSPPAVPNAPSGSGKTPATGQKAQLSLPNQSNILPWANSSSPAPSASTGGGSCPPGFINTVFNTNSGKNVGWPSTTWSSLASHGINDWIGFSLTTLDQKDTYGNCPTMPELNNNQIHVVMDPRDTPAAITMVQGPNPPRYLELFNEPDFSFKNFTPVTDAVTAAKNLAGLFSIPHPQTSYVSPALMNANSDWLTTFKSNCNGCFDQIPIIAMHVYNPDPQGVMDQITQLHATWPDKKIWITELSPATSGCSMQANDMATFMSTLFPKITALGYVDKIFWNSGEWDTPAINGAPDGCNPALTDGGGNPTPVLTALKNYCGGGGTATS